MERELIASHETLTVGELKRAARVFVVDRNAALLQVAELMQFDAAVDRSAAGQLRRRSAVVEALVADALVARRARWVNQVSFHECVSVGVAVEQVFDRSFVAQHVRGTAAVQCELVGASFLRFGLRLLALIELAVEPDFRVSALAE